MKRKLTVRDLAKDLNIHFTTVARALRNDQNISDETRERVLQYAQKVGYETNPLVSALMARKRESSDVKAVTTLSIVTSKLSWSFPTTKRLFQSMDQYARTQGYSCDIFYIDDYPNDSNRVFKIIWNRGSKAIAFIGIREDLIPKDELLKGFALVSCPEHHPTIPSVISDHFEGMGIAMNHIAQLGYKRPGYIAEASFDSIGMTLCSAAFVQEQSRFAKKDRIPVFPYSEGDIAGLNKWLDRWKPDVLIPGWGAIGKKGDSVIQKYPKVWMDAKGDDVMGIDQNREQMGRKTVDVLIASLNGNRFGVPSNPYKLLIAPHWQAGK